MLCLKAHFGHLQDFLRCWEGSESVIFVNLYVNQEFSLEIADLAWTAWISIAAWGPGILKLQCLQEVCLSFFHLSCCCAACVSLPHFRLFMLIWTQFCASLSLSLSLSPTSHFFWFFYLSAQVSVLGCPWELCSGFGSYRGLSWAPDERILDPQ